MAGIFENARLTAWLQRLVLLALLAVAVAARVHNRDKIFNPDGEIYFVDGDCYSRMTRARMVSEGQWIIRHHEFENWPSGTTPHTTAPLDWLIVALSQPMKLAVAKDAPPDRALELAGAWVSPLLGVATCLWLWLWAGRLRLRFRALMVAFFAASPILAHGTLLGRPDHQSLLILLISIAVGSELALADAGMAARRAKKWSLAAGSAWGLAMWVSLFEPVIFFAGAVAWHSFAGKMALTARAVRPRWIALAAVLAVALLVDGWRLTLPDPATKQFLTTWAATIGELKGLVPTGTQPWFWFGAFWFASPLLLWLAARDDRRALGMLPLVVVMIAFTIWQRRWGQFSALAICMSVPWQVTALRRPALCWALGIAALLPLGGEWLARIRPHDRQAAEDRAHALRSVEQELRRIATFMRAEDKRPFAAVWWQSPQLAYWSRQPGIAGTSHQSLAGTVDSARIFHTESPTEAARLLRARGVRYLIIHDIPKEDTLPRRYPAVENSAAILGTGYPAAAFSEQLSESPKKAPPFLRHVTPEERGLVLGIGVKSGGGVQQTAMRFYLAQFFQVYEVVTKE